MKIALISDLHLSHDADEGRVFLDRVFGRRKPGDADICVLAGDWTSTLNEDITDRLFSLLSNTYARVVVVPGNHEYWCASPAETRKGLRGLADVYPNLFLFEKPEILELDDVVFVAGTMWYPKAPNNLPQDFNDYNEVQCKKEWFWNQHKLFLREFCKIPDASIGRHKKFVVVTHHMPSTKSSDPQFLTSPYNHYFVTNMERWILQKGPNLWLHGHGHYPADYMIGGTRVVCNPRGYPFEWKKQPPYTPKIIEI